MVMIGSPSFPVPNLSQSNLPNRPPQPSSMGAFQPSAQSLFNPLSPGKPFPAIQDISSLPAPSARLNTPVRTPFTPIPNSFTSNPFMSTRPTTPYPLGSTLAPPSGVMPGTTFNQPVSGAFRQSLPASAMAQPFRPMSQMPSLRPGVGSALGANAGAMAEQLSPAEEAGQKVGEMVTTLLEENPALQEKIQNINFDELQQDIGPKVESFRAKVQQAIKPIPRIVDRKVIRLFDTPQAQEMATQFDEWLRKPPDPALLAAANRPKPSGGSALESDFSDPYADDPFAEEAESPIKQPPPKKSMLANLKSKVWPFNKGNKENESPMLERPARKRRASEISDADLDAMLNESLGEPGRPARRRRPLPEDELYY